MFKVKTLGIFIFSTLIVGSAFSDTVCKFKQNIKTVAKSYHVSEFPVETNPGLSQNQYLDKNLIPVLEDQLFFTPNSCRLQVSYTPNDTFNFNLISMENMSWDYKQVDLSGQELDLNAILVYGNSKTKMSEVFFRNSNVKQKSNRVFGIKCVYDFDSIKEVTTWSQLINRFIPDLLECN